MHSPRCYQYRGMQDWNETNDTGSIFLRVSFSSSNIIASRLLTFRFARLYLGIIPILLNAGTVTGFTLVGSIVSGQDIAAVNETANISVNVGIGIVCTLSFCLAFLGYRAVHVWQRWQWLPNFLAIVIAVGYGGKHLMNQADHDPASVKSVVGYGSLMAGYFMTFGGTVSDFTVYHDPKSSK